MLDRDRPKAAAKRGASLITRLYASEAAGRRPPRLAQMRRNDAAWPSEADHLEIPGNFARGLEHAKTGAHER